MDVSAANGEPVEKRSYRNELIWYIVLAVFMFADKHLAEFLSPWINTYVFFFIWISAYWIAISLIGKKKRQPINYKRLLKGLIAIFLVVLVWSNLEGLKNSFVEALPESIAWFSPAIFWIPLILLGVFIVYFIEKHSKS